MFLVCLLIHCLYLGFPGSSEGNESAYYAGDPGSIPGSWKTPGGGNGTHSSILAWRVSRTEEPGGPLSILWGLKELDMTEQLTL